MALKNVSVILGSSQGLCVCLSQTQLVSQEAAVEEYLRSSPDHPHIPCMQSRCSIQIIFQGEIFLAQHADVDLVQPVSTHNAEFCILCKLAVEMLGMAGIRKNGTLCLRCRRKLFYCPTSKTELSSN